MTVRGLALFDTALGTAGIAWSERGVAGVQLPEADRDRARRRLHRRFAGAAEAEPPPEVRRAVDGITALLGGEPVDLGAVPLDMDCLPAFDRRVYDVARTIPAGATLTYGDVAARLGDRRAARDVGQALARNPFAIVVPCHRVLAARDRVGGFSALGGVATKLRLLSIEGALFV
jgi:methylated-DNA-[protein]-cysteine S-methyltransferase